MCWFSLVGFTLGTIQVCAGQDVSPTPASLPPAPAIVPRGPVVVPPTPFVVPPTPGKIVTPSPENSACREGFERARAAFRESDAPSAADLVTRALTACPQDANLLEFRGLVLFAQGSYREASASVHLALKSRPRWRWDVVAGLYPTVEAYTTHLRALEAFARKHPDHSDARFLQAYHYLLIGYPDAARHELEMVVRLDGDDQLAAEMLRELSRSPLTAARPQALLTPPAP